jgi:hypothetical protein
MVRTGILALVIIAAAGPTLYGQEPWQFQWRAGQTLDYRVQHTTSVTEVVQGARVETRSKLDLVKRWQVIDVDAQGVATVQLVLTSMRNEQTRPNGETLLFDSRNLDKSTPELREMSKFLGKPLAVLRLDRFGRTHEVKVGSAARYEAEPPFVLVLPGAAPKDGQAWVRPFKVTLEPPLGAGEKHPAQHRFTCKKIEGNQATVSLATEFKEMPDAPQDRLPLLQKETQGEVIFDIAAGRMARAQLNIDKTVENHQGAGSSYHLVSAYIEELVVP